MPSVSAASKWLAASTALVSAPGVAGPNVFWTFGFDRHYAHGTGGYAELRDDTRLAHRTSPDADAPVLRASLALNDTPLSPQAAARPASDLATVEQP